MANKSTQILVQTVIEPIKLKVFLSRRNDLQSQVVIEMQEEMMLENLLGAHIQYNNQEEIVNFYHQNRLIPAKTCFKDLFVYKQKVFIEYDIEVKPKTELIIIEFHNPSIQKQIFTYVQKDEQIKQYLKQIIGSKSFDKYLFKIFHEQIDTNSTFSQYLVPQQNYLKITYYELEELKIRDKNQLHQILIDEHVKLNEIGDQIKNKFDLKNSVAMIDNKQLNEYSDKTWFQIKNQIKSAEIVIQKLDQSITVEAKINDQSFTYQIDNDETVQDLIEQIRIDQKFPQIQEVTIYYNKKLLKQDIKIQDYLTGNKKQIELSVKTSETFELKLKNKNQEEIGRYKFKLNDTLQKRIPDLELQDYEDIKFYQNNIELSKDVQFCQLNLKPDTVVEFDVIEFDQNDTINLTVQLGQRNLHLRVPCKFQLTELRDWLYEHLLIQEKLKKEAYELKFSNKKDGGYLSEQEIRSLSKQQKQIQLYFARC